MDLSRTITGGIIVAISIALILLPFIFGITALYFLWIYGIPLLILGLFVLFNKKENKIEQIKSNKTNLKKRKR